MAMYSCGNGLDLSRLILVPVSTKTLKSFSTSPHKAQTSR